MRDPHVVRLHYKVRSDSRNIAYKDPEPLEFTNALGSFTLRDMALVFEPAEHFSTRHAARTAVEPFLRSWTIRTDLTEVPGTIVFDFDRADLVDRDPPPPGSPQTLRGEAAVVFAVAAQGSLHQTWNRYPEPPLGFRATPEIEEGYRRWRLFREGEESLQTMAYFVLTLLEKLGRGRDGAARKYDIDLDILSKIGELSSRGDASTARKAPKAGDFVELAASEQRWLEHAVKRLLLHVGEHAARTSPTRLKLSDLPPA